MSILEESLLLRSHRRSSVPNGRRRVETWLALSSGATSFKSILVRGAKEHGGLVAGSFFAFRERESHAQDAGRSREQYPTRNDNSAAGPIAERIATLGGVAEGTAAIAAERSTPPAYPLHIADLSRSLVDSLPRSVACTTATLESSFWQGQGVSQGWHHPPGEVMMREYGFTAENVCKRVLALLA